VLTQLLRTFFDFVLVSTPPGGSKSRHPLVDDETPSRSGYCILFDTVYCVLYTVRISASALSGTSGAAVFQDALYIVRVPPSPGGSGGGSGLSFSEGDR
jgi:hypothetical protein